MARQPMHAPRLVGTAEFERVRQRLASVADLRRQALRYLRRTIALVELSEERSPPASGRAAQTADARDRVQAAMARWFPPSSELHRVLTLLRQATLSLRTVDFDVISRPSIDLMAQLPRQVQLHREEFLRAAGEAHGYTLSNGQYFAVWEEDPGLLVSTVVHEAFHTNLHGGPNLLDSGAYNPYAFVGFVAELAGMPADWDFNLRAAGLHQGLDAATQADRFRMPMPTRPAGRPFLDWE